MSETLALTQALIAQPSITPEDKDCQNIIRQRLKAAGFEVTALPFGEVANLWATYGSSSHPLIVFAGHTDVVPPGPLDSWDSDPFTPTIRDGHLFGRGAADMKSGLAAMITAAERFLQAHPKPNLRIGFLITSDEEGTAQDGTRRVVETLQTQGVEVTYCVIGEASSEKQLGDTIKNGRRGSLNGRMVIYGTQGHIAYPQLADNPIHKSAALIRALTEHQWDQGNAHFPATRLQISNIHAGTGADNVIPGELTLDFNFRYSSETTADELRHTTEQIAKDQGIKCNISWRHSGEPFLTSEGMLTQTLQHAIQEVAGVTAQLSTSGGTSDGRFIAKMGCQVVEFGPCNASIHKVNEHINIEALEQLSCIYERVLTLLATAD